jgi:hypothetical protein
MNNGNRRRSRFDHFLDSTKGTVCASVVAIVMFGGFGWIAYDQITNEVTVYQSWNTKQILKVEDAKGRELTNYNLSKLRYTVEWVK